MFRLKNAAPAALLLALASCTGDAGSPLAPDGGPALAIADAAHTAAAPGFYFLPPTVKGAAPTGTFDAALQPRVEICELSGSACGAAVAAYTFGTGLSSVKLDAAGQNYSVNWNAPGKLNPDRFYRIQVFVGTFRLGYADVDVVRNGKEKNAVDETQFIALMPGQTLPIKFRIETGIAAALVVSPASASINSGATQQFTASVTDLHGAPLPSAAVSWASSDAAVATVDGTGLATGVSTGTATISASLGAVSGSATLTVLNPNTPPVAAADTFQAIGNVTVPVAAPGVLANDTDAEGNSLSAVAGVYATVAGGSVTLNADGSFTYLSAAGFTGTDSFQYGVTDGQVATTATATVVSASRVWYVDNSAASAGDGRDASPFATLKGAESASSAGETVLVRAGNGGAAGYDDGFIMKAGQSLTGQGISSPVQVLLNGATLTLLTPAGTPNLARAGAGTGIQLASNNTVQGVRVATSDGAGITGGGFGAFTAGQVVVDATGGPALNLENGTVGASFDALSSAASATNGLRLVNVGGTLNAPGGTIGGAAGPAVLVLGGDANAAYGGDVLSTVRTVQVEGRTGGTLTLSGSLNDTGAGILVRSNSAGTIAFTGSSKVLSTGSEAGVTLDANGAAAIQFAGGGLNITTASADGFRATNGGLVTVTGAGNSIATAGGTAVSLDGVSSGVQGISFQSVSATGGTTVIRTNDLDGAGLQVTGTGTVAGSGGLIQNTTGDAVALSGAGVVKLRLMLLRPLGMAVNASGFTGSALVERTLVDVVGAAAGKPAIQLANTAGTGSLALDGTRVVNKADGAPAVSVSAGGAANLDLAVRDSNTGDAFPSEFSNLFGNAVRVQSGFTGGSTARADVHVSDSRFVNAASNGTNNIDLSVGENATLGYVIRGNLFEDVARASLVSGVINIDAFGSGRVGAVSADSISGNVIRNIGTGSAVTQLGYVGIRVALDNGAAGVNHRVNIRGNTITNLWRQGILISARNQTSNANVQITGNTVGTAAAPVGRSNRRAVEVETQGSAYLKVAVLNNPSIVNTASSGNSALHIRSTGAGSDLSATVTGNTIGNTNAAITGGRFRAETLGGTSAKVCLDLRGNTLDAAASLYELSHASAGSFRVEGPGAAMVTGPDITAANVVGTGSVSGTPVFSGGVACAQPSL
ncbi:MAG TPA: Ig-like domain-containing protein [Longimicrobium sp.]|uniref:Ig-like domain-containing protein n=1 Tax=Longimicrobium sp. TaxID=2029185 RepID=UPI002ED8D1D1